MSGVQLTVRSWRITQGVPAGCHCWFDPKTEEVRLFRIPLHEQRVFRNQQEFDSERGSTEVDTDVSVRASETEAELALSQDEQLILPEGTDQLPF